MVERAGDALGLTEQLERTIGYQPPRQRIQTGRETTAAEKLTESDPAIFVVSLRSTVLATATMRSSWMIVEKPDSAAVSLYGPGARSRNGNCRPRR